MNGNVNEKDLSSDDKLKKKSKKELELEIEELKLKLEKFKEDYLRSLAELENFKKRMNEERNKDRIYANISLLSELLNPLDQLKKVVNYNVEDEMLKNYLIGFKMINDSIFQVLEDQGLKEIEALNKPFDPNYHYAIEKVNLKDVENGIITEVINVGYQYKDRIVKPAMVKVNEWSEENNEENK